jgi:hypothetical protein
MFAILCVCCFVLWRGSLGIREVTKLRKFVCFVLFVLMRSTEPGCFRSRSWSLWKSSRGQEVHQLGSMVFGLAVQKQFLNIE